MQFEGRPGITEDDLNNPNLTSAAINVMIKSICKPPLKRPLGGTKDDKRSFLLKNIEVHHDRLKNAVQVHQSALRVNLCNDIRSPWRSTDDRCAVYTEGEDDKRGGLGAGQGSRRQQFIP